MQEYEYSFKVKSINPYITYCKDNGYRTVSVIEQNRVVYENKNNKNLIARMTTIKKNGKQKTVLDFKNVETSQKQLKVSTESIPLNVTSRNKKSIDDMLEILGFYIAANNLRVRYVYQKGKVTFEIDDYIEPKMQVVAIEGEKEHVDSVYLDVKSYE